MTTNENLISNSDTKRKIFSEAAKLFSERGYYAVSMREISERAGVTKPTIYYYFGSKDGIYEQLISESIKWLDKITTTIRNQNGSSKEKLTQLLKHHFDACLKYPEYVKFIYSIVTSREKLPFLDNFQQKALKERQLLIDIIKSGIQKNEFGAGADPELASLIIEAVISQFIWLHIETNAVTLSDQLAERIIELIFKGLNE